MLLTVRPNFRMHYKDEVQFHWSSNSNNISSGDKD